MGIVKRGGPIVPRSTGEPWLPWRAEHATLLSELRALTFSLRAEDMSVAGQLGIWNTHYAPAKLAYLANAKTRYAEILMVAQESVYAASALIRKYDGEFRIVKGVGGGAKAARNVGVSYPGPNWDAAPEFRSIGNCFVVGRRVFIAHRTIS